MPVAEPFNRLPFLGHAALFGCKWDKGFEERSRITFPCRQGGRREKTIDDEIWGLPRKFPDSIGRWLTEWGWRCRASLLGSGSTIDTARPTAFLWMVWEIACWSACLTVIAGMMVGRVAHAMAVCACFQLGPKLPNPGESLGGAASDGAARVEKQSFLLARILKQLLWLLST